MASFIDYYFILKFVKILTTPFIKTDAYKLGIIDENGNYLKSMVDLKTQEEKNAYTYTDRLVWNLKKLLNKLPGGKNTIATFAVAFWLLKEENVISNMDYIVETVKKQIPFLQSLIVENNDNNIKNINIGKYKLKYSIDENHNVDDNILILNSNPVGRVLNTNIFECVNMENGEYTYVPVEYICNEEDGTVSIGNTTANLSDTSNAVGMMGQVQRRKFAGVDVFDVDQKTFGKFLQGKKKYSRWKNYIDEEDTDTKELLDYARKYPCKNMIVKNKSCGGMIYLRNYQ